MVVMVLVAMSFANNFLGSRMAENEFATNKQFMLTTALQIDDIAWTIGRTQTVRYSSQIGNTEVQADALKYSVEVKGTGTGGVWEPLFSDGVVTDMILFNIPVSSYSMGNNYFVRVSPTSTDSFLQRGTSATVSHVFCVEKLPMADGSFTRIVVVPTVRRLDTSIGSEHGQTNYTKFYLPSLESGIHRYLSQSITLTGDSIVKVVKSGVAQVRITVTFPSESLGFDSGFFNFVQDSEIIDLSSSAIVEFYVGNVIVKLGQV